MLKWLQKALHEALACLQKEDPSLTVTHDAETGQTLLNGLKLDVEMSGHDEHQAWANYILRSFSTVCAASSASTPSKVGRVSALRDI
jgi:hypothetical protein